MKKSCFGFGQLHWLFVLDTKPVFFHMVLFDIRCIAVKVDGLWFCTFRCFKFRLWQNRVGRDQQQGEHAGKHGAGGVAVPLCRVGHYRGEPLLDLGLCVRLEQRGCHKRQAVLAPGLLHQGKYHPQVGGAFLLVQSPCNGQVALDLQGLLQVLLQQVHYGIPPEYHAEQRNQQLHNGIVVEKMRVFV